MDADALEFARALISPRASEGLGERAADFDWGAAEQAENAQAPMLENAATVMRLQVPRSCDYEK